MKRIFAAFLLIMTSLACTDKSTDVASDVRITSFSPESGGKGTVITIMGQGFGTNTANVSATINGLQANIVAVADGQVSLEVPAKCGLGTVDLSVGGKSVSSEKSFRYLYAATVSYFSGGAKGYADGAAASVKFEGPYQIAQEASGNLVFADLGNCMIRRTDLNGTVSTIAGTPHSGFADGTGDQALMQFPIGVDVGPDGVIYLTDHKNNAIRKIGTDNKLVTISGAPDRPGNQNGVAKTATFFEPYGVSIKGGVLWVCDSGNGLIRKISADGQVSTFAGSTAGFADGALTQAKFYYPVQLAFGKNGEVFVADKHNHCIRKITTDGQVSVFAGQATKKGFADGASAIAQFDQPSGVRIDDLGNLYVTDLYNHCIRMIYPDGQVATLAGVPKELGYMEGIGNQAKFYHPQGSVLAKDGMLYVTDSFNNRIRKIKID